ncbi:MAG: hypothetical protein ABI400_07035, partial [Lacisediminihabitans sp.]
MYIPPTEETRARADLERDRLRVSAERRAVLIIAAAVVLLAAAWATLPYGIVLLTQTSALGLLLTVSGVLLLIAAIVVGALGARRWRHARANGSAPKSAQGRPNPTYGEGGKPLSLPAP